MDTRAPRHARFDKPLDSVMLSVIVPGDGRDQELEIRWLRREELLNYAEIVEKPDHPSADGNQIPFTVLHDGEEIKFHLSRNSFLSLVEAMRSQNPVFKVEAWNTLYGA